MMDENNIGSIVILKNRTNANNKDKRPIGIVTERDVVRTIGHAGLFSIHTSVREIMSSPVITINPNGMEIMQQKDILRLPGRHNHR